MFCSRAIAQAIKLLLFLLLSSNFTSVFAQADNQNPYQAPFNEVRDIASTRVMDLKQSLESLNDKVKSGEMTSNEQIVHTSFQFLVEYHMVIPQFVKNFPDDILQFDHRVMAPILFFLFSEDIQVFYDHAIKVNADPNIIKLLLFAKIRIGNREVSYYKANFKYHVFFGCFVAPLGILYGTVFCYVGDELVPKLFSSLTLAASLVIWIRFLKDFRLNKGKLDFLNKNVLKSKASAQKLGMSDIIVSSAEKAGDLDACQASFLSLYLLNQK